VTWSVQPEPGDEAERKALLSALEQVLAEDDRGPAGYASPWWRSGLEDLRLGWSPAAEQPGREPGVVEP
jgi:hypothetical protein